MKKIILITVICLNALHIQAQNPYSSENLLNLSQGELDTYYGKAIKLQKSGKILNIVGVSILGATTVTIAGIAIADQGDWALGAAVIGFFGGLAGVGTFAVGIPMNLTGKARVNRINSIRNTASHDMVFELQPIAHFNSLTQNYQPAVTFRIKF